MDFNKIFDTSNRFWEETLPTLSLLCSDDRKTSQNSPEVALDPSVLSPEPRSISSSELSEQNLPGISENLNFTIEEDAKLCQLVNQHNYDWKLISKSFTKYNKFTLQSRWNYLTSKSPKHSFWKQEEDDLIEKLYETYNGNWKKISEFVPGRSVAALKNRFYGVLRKKKLPKTPSKAQHQKIDSIRTSDSLSDDTHFENYFSQPFDNLTPEQKREKINQLYNLMMTLQNRIEKTKEKIEKIQVSENEKLNQDS